MSDVQRYLLRVDEDKDSAQRIAEETAQSKVLHRPANVWMYGLIACRSGVEDKILDRCCSVSWGIHQR